MPKHSQEHFFSFSLTNLLLISEDTVLLYLKTKQNSPWLWYQQKITLSEQFCQLEIIYFLKGLVLWVTDCLLARSDNIQFPLMSAGAESSQ